MNNYFENVFYEDEIVKMFDQTWEGSRLRRTLSELSRNGFEDIVVLPRPKFEIPTIMPLSASSPKEEETYNPFRTSLMYSMVSTLVPSRGYIIKNIVEPGGKPVFWKKHRNTKKLRQFIKGR